jgi:hypothetical protein
MWFQLHYLILKRIRQRTARLWNVCVGKYVCPHARFDLRMRFWINLLICSLIYRCNMDFIYWELYELWRFDNDLSKSVDVTRYGGCMRLCVIIMPLAHEYCLVFPSDLFPLLTVYVFYTYRYRNINLHSLRRFLLRSIVFPWHLLLFRTGKDHTIINTATITNRNLIQEEITRRLNSGNACYHSIQNLLSSRLLPKNIKIRIYKTIILPVVLYGCET